jgi:predicted dehydrogenase
LDITGTKAFGRLDFIQQALTLYENPHINEIDDVYSNFEDYITKFDQTDEIRVGLTKAEPLKLELENFISSIRGESEPFIRGEEAISALEIALAL